MTIPVTILSGYLGAGKTTFLNYILEQGPIDPSRILIIVNEIGDVGFDHQFLLEQEQPVYQLNSGCMCCSLQGDLLSTLINLYREHQSGSLDFDHLIIETTGIADPIPVANAVNSAIAHEVGFVVDSIYTLVDSQNYQAHLASGPEALEQIIGADRIYITKGGSEDVVEAINPYNPFVEIRFLSLEDDSATADFFNQGLHDQVDFEALGEIGEGNERVEAAEVDSRAHSGSHSGSHSGPDSSAHPHSQSHDHHHHDVETLVLKSETPLREDYFQSFVDWLIASHGEHLYRYKGVLYFKGFADPFVFQGVYDQYHFQEIHERDIGAHSQWVIIGRNLHSEQIKLGWQQLCQLSQSDRPY